MWQREGKCGCRLQLNTHTAQLKNKLQSIIWSLKTVFESDVFGFDIVFIVSIITF